LKAFVIADCGNSRTWKSIRHSPRHGSRVERILQRLDVISAPEQMNLPGWRLHPLKGDLKGFWSVTVNGNWRVIFAWTGSAATNVDFLDYH
jgi:toxin HigB-1